MPVTCPKEWIPGYRFDDTIILPCRTRRVRRWQQHVPGDEAATKLLFPVLSRFEKEWIMPPRQWPMAKSRFALLSGERFTPAMA